MKILVMSLLRLGDVVMTTPLLSALKTKYPESKVHLLLNRQFKHLEPLIPHVDKFIYFERDELQRGLGETDRAFFEPYDRLSRLIQDLNEEMYDWSINTTHNRLSGWLMGLIDAERKDGLSLHNDGSPDFGSKWFEVLNRHEAGSTRFHMVDILCFGTGFKGTNRRVNLVETVAGRDEAAQITLGFGPYIAVQPCTSDSKKEWGDDNYVRLGELLSQVDSSRHFLILGSAGEKSRLEKLSEKLHAKKVKHKIAICSLEGALTLVKNADLVITGDTAIKHFASATTVPVIELSLGSSSFEFTGCYSEKAYILQSLEPCAPCGHRDACPYESHRCAERLSPECVSLVAQAVVRKSREDLQIIAQEFSDQVKILKTSFSAQGEWKAYPVSVKFDNTHLIQWIDRSSQRIYLNESKSEMVEFGTESLQLEKLFTSIFPERDKVEWVETYKTLESTCAEFKSEIENVLSELKIVIRDFDSNLPFERLRVRLSRIVNDVNLRRHFGSYVEVINESLADVNPEESKFLLVKRIRESVSSLNQRIDIEMRLIKSLRTQLLEKV